MSIKIMHITQSNGGVARYLQMLLKYMKEDKYEHILVYPTEYKNEEQDFVGLVEKIEFIEMCREINLLQDIKSTVKIIRILKKYNPDVLYLHSSKAGALGRIAGLFFRKKIIYNPHGWAFNMETTSVKSKIYIFIEKFLSNFCARIIAISNQEKISAIEHKICKPSKIELIYNGIDILKYDDMSRALEKTDFLHQNEIPKEAIIVGMVGRLSNQKSPEIFVEVAAKIKLLVPNAFFIIVGDGEEKENILLLIEKLGLTSSFLITGWVDNTYQYVEKFDIAMLLSKWEGFGLVVAEYMISKKPIIVSNVDAIPDLISHNKEGILININDQNSIVESVITLLENREFSKQLACNADFKVRQKFDIRRVAREHEKLIGSILK